MPVLKAAFMGTFIFYEQIRYTFAYSKVSSNYTPKYQEILKNIQKILDPPSLFTGGRSFTNRKYCRHCYALWAT